MSFASEGRLGAVRAAAGKIDRRFLMAARCGIFMLLGLVMSCAGVSGSASPFGIAMVGASGPGLSGIFALMGAGGGYLLSCGIERGIRYVAASVLIYTLGFVFNEIGIYKKRLFMPLASSAVTALSGFLGSFYSPSPLPLAAELFLESVLAFGACFFFAEALSNKPRSTEAQELLRSASYMIMSSCALMAFARIELFSVVSLGRFMSLLLVMTSAMKGGMLSGAAVGTVLGLAMDLSRQGVPFYTMSYSLSGLFSGVFGRQGRLIFVLSFIFSGALSVAAVWNTQVYISALFEIFSASVVFMVLPAPFISNLGLMLSYIERGKGEAGLRRYASGRLMNLSEAYSGLYEILEKNISRPYNDENIARVFDRAADQVCVECKNKNLCWNAQYVDTLSAMNDASRAMNEKGSLSPEDLPEFFRQRCTSLPAFTSAVNGELRGLSYRRQLRVRLSENRSLAWAQYAHMAQILKSAAEELGSIKGSDPLAEKRLLRYMRSMEIDGDAAVYRDGSGRLHAVIEGGRLSPLTKDPDYLEKLSALIGVRLCRPFEAQDGESRITLLEAEPLAVSVGIAALKKKGESVSGDRGSYFKTDAGVLCVLLSDGMGTGSEAAEDSARVCAILEKFLRAGLDPALSMKTLNSVMLLRSADSWGYATVDLMCVDLFTGETCFYKYGAAPSYVKSGKSIRRINCETLAAGLTDAGGIAPDIVRMRLRPGSTALIASDGVISSRDDGWIKALLEEDFEDMKSLARAVLREAENCCGKADDMTVLSVRVEERK